jgi:poly(beta-D-mannuronate) lyase
MFLNKKRTYAALATLLATQTYAQIVPLNNPSFENNFNGWNDTDPSSISSVAFDGNRSVKITG